MLKFIVSLLVFFVLFGAMLMILCNMISGLSLDKSKFWVVAGILTTVHWGVWLMYNILIWLPDKIITVFGIKFLATITGIKWIFSAIVSWLISMLILWLTDKFSDAITFNKKSSLFLSALGVMLVGPLQRLIMIIIY